VGLQSPQYYRPILCMVIAASSMLAFSQIPGVETPSMGVWLPNSLALLTIYFPCHISNALLIEKYALGSSPQNSRTWEWNWRGAWMMLWNGRWIGTYKQPKDILPIDVDSSRRWLPLPINFPRPKSPRLIFIRNRILSLIEISIIYYLHHIIMEVPHGYFAPLSIHDFSISKQTYFRRLLPRSSSTLTSDLPTIRETQIRIYIVVHFIGFCYALFTFLYEILAVAFVATGVDDPEDWPPFFGKLTEAYSIRNFWGKFWHKLIYRTYTSYGKVISIDVLRIPQKGILGRLFVNFFVFLSSGIVHQVVTRHLGLTCGYWLEDISFFLANFAAIILEMAVQNIFERICRIARRTCPDHIKITVGYFWVFGFLFWSLPKLEYPKQLCASRLE
jgi:hypothetical protein